MIKVGLSPVLIDLMERGLVTGIAMNGAGIVHDFEMAIAGATSEDVQAGLGRGEFGMAHETGAELCRAVVEGDRDGLGLSGRRRYITVLFADVRGFTAISEKIDPEQVVSFLSEYFAQITQIVFKHGGTVDKFIGDGMMAIFGAPKSYGDDALRAVRTGLEMIAMVETMNPQWSKLLGQSVKVGVGINSGDAVVGSIGSEIKSDFTAIGDTVNLAARLEGLTKELRVPILISEFTAAELNNALPLKALQRVRVTRS